MTDEEMAEKYAKANMHYEIAKRENRADYAKEVSNVTIKQAFLAGLEYKNKENAELKEKISILLSCKNCPENKGGWICAKEYEDKCLAQKIEFIKELEKENAELKEQCSILADSNVCKEAQTYKHYIKIPFKGESPVYSTKQAAGADIALPKDIVVKAHSIVAWIDLEVGFDIPEGFCIMLQPRSSTSRKWHVLCDTGIIDSDYKLENIHCGLVNVTDEDIIIPKGTRIVQLLILPVYHATNWKCLNTIRDSKKGSGSTGD